MAAFSPLGTDYGVDDTTLTYMYNPSAPRPNVSIAPKGYNLPIYSTNPNGSNATLFEPNGITPLPNNDGVLPNISPAPVAQPIPMSTQGAGFNPIQGPSPMAAAQPSPMASGFSPISGPAYNAVNGNSSYSPPITSGVPGVTGPSNTGMSTGFGDTLSSGWNAIGGWQGLQSGLQTAGGLFQAYQGMQALDLAKEKFGFQKDAWQANYDMQKDAYDRQVAQVESRRNFLQRGGSDREENQ